MNPEKLAGELVEWMRDEVRGAGCEGLVFGLSGGVDSATAGVLARRAFRKGHLALILPIRSPARDLEDARLVAEKFGLNREEIDLGPAYDSFLRILGEAPERRAGADLARHNIKPRLRMVTLYYHAARHDYLVVGCGNRSELTIGYFTKYGDGGVDLLPLGHLVKREVRLLAEHLGVPRSIIDKEPSAGIWRGQTDAAELGFSYDELDRYLEEGVGSDDLAARIEELRRSNAHKLRIPKMPPAART